MSEGAPNPSPHRDEVVRTIVGFLRDVGLEVDAIVGPGGLPVEGPLPGVAIRHGALVYVERELVIVGDLLHEAGHLALLPPEQRATAHGALPPELGTGYELGAICWSYAAAVQLRLPPEVVFDDAGYRGDASWIIDRFEHGTAIGLPLLVWAGLAEAPTDVRAPGAPKMLRWVRS